MIPASKSLDWLSRLWRWGRPAAGRVADRQQRGARSERLARAYLERLGYEIEATNMRFRAGELDLVARDRDVLCFIEVRSVGSSRFGTAAESVTPRKQQRMLRAVRQYLSRRRPAWPGGVRCDVVALDASGPGQPRISLLRSAFDASDVRGRGAWL